MLGRLVTGPIAFLVGGIADLLIYGLGALGRTWRGRAERTRRDGIGA